MPAIPKKRATDRRGAPKGKRGNPPFAATQEQRLTVAAMTAAGGTHAIIARHLAISEDTLERHFPDELKLGTEIMLAEIGGLVFKDAMAGCKASRFFILKCRGGWRETSRVEHSGPDGGPIANLTVDEVLAKRAEVVDEC